MDITIDIEDYKLNVRAAVVIIHNNKILLHPEIGIGVKWVWAIFVSGYADAQRKMVNRLYATTFFFCAVIYFISFLSLQILL